MISPVNLAQMEYSLYGTSGLGTTMAPSMMNGYRMPSFGANSQYSGMYNNQYGTYYPNYYQSYYNNYNGSDVFQSTQSQGQAQQQSDASAPSAPAFGSQKDWNTLAKYYTKSSAPSEGLIGTTLGGAAFGLIQNPRLIAHPWNSMRGLKETRKMFADIKTEGSALRTLWQNPETNDLMREAYFRMHKLESRKFTRLPIIRNRYSEADYNKLKEIMKDALKLGEAEDIAEATAKLKVAYVNDGWLGKLFSKIRGKDVTVEAALKDTNKINSAKNEILNSAKNLMNGNKFSYAKALKRGGLFGSLFFVGIEFLCSAGDIKSAFAKDKETGNTHYGRKQLGQTAVKAVGSAAGWAAGEALGVMGAAKICSAIGTAIAPGVGTAIGGVLGLIGGSIGCWLTGKLTHAMVGENVGAELENQKLAQTDEGRSQLLQLTLQNVKKDKNVDQDTLLAINNIIQSANAVA